MLQDRNTTGGKRQHSPGSLADVPPPTKRQRTSPAPPAARAPGPIQERAGLVAPEDDKCDSGNGNYLFFFLICSSRNFYVQIQVEYTIN